MLLKLFFGDACAHWDCLFKLDEVIDVFYRSMGLTPYIYPETVAVLEKLRSQGYIIATLTDVATGMPDELHKAIFPSLCRFPPCPVAIESLIQRVWRILRSVFVSPRRK